MQPWFLRKINLLLAVMLLCLLVLVIIQYSSQQAEAPQIPQKIAAVTDKLPYSFQQKPEEYARIGTGFMQLEKTAQKTQLPDLRGALISFGMSQRPDAPEGQIRALVGIRGMNPQSLVAGEKTYLKHDPRAGHHRWIFSENNAPTNVWLEIEVQQGQVLALVKMLHYDGTILSEPYDYSYFVLAQMPHHPTQQNLQGFHDWTIGDVRVDAAYFHKQKVRWLGQDLFLAHYGGEKYSYTKDRQRIDFETLGDFYSCFIQENDLLAFNGDAWENVVAGEASRGKSLLEVKKIDPDVILFDLWEPEGRQRLSLELRKTAMGAAPKSFDLKLVGAKSRKEWIVEIGGKRTGLKLDDWLILRETGHERITSNEDIDNYLAGKVKGELIILEGIQRVDNEYRLIGNRFNEARTEITEISIPLYKTKDERKERADVRQANAIPNKPYAGQPRAHAAGVVEDDDDDVDDDDFDNDVSDDDEEEDEEDDEDFR